MTGLERLKESVEKMITMEDSESPYIQGYNKASKDVLDFIDIIAEHEKKLKTLRLNNEMHRL